MSTSMNKNNFCSGDNGAFALMLFSIQSIEFKIYFKPKLIHANSIRRPYQFMKLSKPAVQLLVIKSATVLFSFFFLGQI